MFSLPCELVFQQVRKHIPAIICYGLAKAEFAAFLVFRHRLDANILNTNGIIAIYEVAGLLVQEVTALIGNFLMEDSHTLPLLVSVAASLLSFG